MQERITAPRGLLTHRTVVRIKRRGPGEHPVGLQVLTILLLIFLLCWCLLSHLRLCSLGPHLPPRALCPVFSLIQHWEMPRQAFPWSCLSANTHSCLHSRHVSETGLDSTRGPGPASSRADSHIPCCSDFGTELPTCAISNPRLPKGASSRGKIVSRCLQGFSFFRGFPGFSFKGIKALFSNI